MELIKGDRGQNQNLAEGVAFRGRLMIAIRTSYQPDSSKIGVDVRSCNPVSNVSFRDLLIQAFMSFLDGRRQKRDVLTILYHLRSNVDRREDWQNTKTLNI